MLDTHLLLWAAAGTLSPQAEHFIVDEDNFLFFSSASIWEIVIKTSLGRADFLVDPKEFLSGLLRNGYQEVPITSAHALAVQNLPTLHKDPFDRILLAQAQLEGLVILTSDRILGQYPGPIIVI